MSANPPKLSPTELLAELKSPRARGKGRGRKRSNANRAGKSVEKSLPETDENEPLVSEAPADPVENADTTESPTSEQSDRVDEILEATGADEVAINSEDASDEIAEVGGLEADDAPLDAGDPFDSLGIDFDDLNSPTLNDDPTDNVTDAEESEGEESAEVEPEEPTPLHKNPRIADVLKRLGPLPTDADRRDGVLGETDTDHIVSSAPDVAKPQRPLTALFDRVNSLLGGSHDDSTFRPPIPETIAETGLNIEDIEKLALKYLLGKGTATGRQICTQVCLPFQIVDPILKQLKHDQLLAFRGTAEMGDYEFTITDMGRDRARAYMREGSYSGAAPVPLGDYLKAMAAQSIARQEATEADLEAAFSDLIINKTMLRRLGPAINSGRGMFLFGEPGNGKTSIAERITKCFGTSIWIPRSLGIDGDIVRVFDPGMHEVITEPQDDGLFDLSGVDPRWVQIVRPTVIAGGELTMSMLEVCQNPATKICEAPLQLKSNCGTLVIDDFGRQTMPVDELLNRWIVPLEKRYDFLNLPSGKKVQVPFDQLIIFSTNLEPKDLVDGAFLRRIPYKIEVPDPSKEEFLALFKLMSPIMGFEYKPDAVDYLIQTHYEPMDRPYRACQPRDLLLQVRNYCVYHKTPKVLSNEAFDFAVENYFSVM
ncbi:AAA family ATPase [Thalassoroseus pseudoceratinae]|uniref:AAA family ATPase n=1 Tax=Thalassoroseus pseudoceratinae TaxID=2713176 RepID=UPI001F119114|nr:AAA family ATPase [Thalassoroseus pseudoceratinae]